MSEVFLCEKGQLDERSKRDLRKAGIVVAEVEDLARAAFIRASEVVSADDMLWACLDALRVDTGNYGRDQRERLVHNLFRVVVEDRKKAGKFVRTQQAAPVSGSGRS